jgi:hypothetical protein
VQPIFTDSDKHVYLSTLEKWKARQTVEKPVVYFITVSGGGTRSAAFTMDMLQQLDSITHGNLMKQTILMTGASGGMIGAAYFRSLYYEKQKGKAINLRDRQYTNNISKDLLNPLFSSFVSKDLVGPASKFTENNFRYVKDRAYSFEQKLNENTGGLLDKKLSDYAAPEANAEIPMLIFNASITRDARKVIIATRPARFLMQADYDTAHIMQNDPDGIDFASFFKDQDAQSLSVLSALRMNATFPFALPNVWLPSTPVIDVMDAGLRDDFGQEEALRFISVFKDWFKENTSKIVMIQIRDRQTGDWDKPFDTDNFLGFMTKPFMILQNNWFKLQDYYQTGELKYMNDDMDSSFYRIVFQYTPSNVNATASLSFHLTNSEKIDIASAMYSANNKAAFDKLKTTLK